MTKDQKAKIKKASDLLKYIKDLTTEDSEVIMATIEAVIEILSDLE